MDEQDRTVFKQPSAGGDSTVLKPTPGRRAPLEGRPPPVTPSAYAQDAAPLMGGNPADLARLTKGFGLNPLVTAASTLILVFDKTRGTLRHANVAGLHNSLVAEIKNFETRVRELNLKSELAWAARYLLCTALDEAVLYTPWGEESPWGQRTLLSIFHRETGGGEKCFQILEQLRAAPAENRQALELFYIILSLGFEGRYRLLPNGKDALEALRNELFTSIRHQRGDYERSLSSAWQGLGNTRRQLAHYLPTWVAGSVVAAIIFFAYIGFRVWLTASSEPTLNEIRAIAPLSAEQNARPPG